MADANDGPSPGDGGNAANGTPVDSQPAIRHQRLFYGFYVALAFVALVGLTLFTFDIWPFGIAAPGICDEAIFEGQEINRLNLEPAMKKAELMCDVATEMRWYAYNGRIDQFVHSSGLVIIILLTLATSFLMGSGWTDSSSTAKTVTIALPLLSAAVAAILSQFSLQESMQLRELGRIKAREIFHAASDLDPGSATFADDLRKLRDALLKLEYDQATKYYQHRFSASAKLPVDPPPNDEGS